MKRSRQSKLRIVVLAAGLSARLGQSKPLARIAGSSLLRRTLRATAGLGDGPVIVVVPSASAAIKFEARGFDVLLVENRRRAEGLSSSVRRAIGIKGSWSGVLLLPVDLAFLSRRELMRLISAWRGRSRQTVARGVDSQSGSLPSGKPQGGKPLGGTPLILPRWLKAQGLAIEGDVGLRELLARLPAAQVRLIDLPSAAFDVDTPPELAAARRRRVNWLQSLQA